LKILLAYGTRPELIKLAPLIFELKRRKDAKLLILNTGQHKEMVNDLEKLFCIKPDIQFNVMTHNQGLNSLLSGIIKKTTFVFDKFKPDVVIIQGDTTTVLSIGIAAFYANIKVAHVEAGLRSYDVYNPYPEEFNRRVISLFAKYNFVPTKSALQNLLKENVKPGTVFVTGNTIVDALYLVSKKINEKHTSSGKRQILITAHRRENHGKGLKNICKAVKTILKTHTDVKFIWPVHPNPNVESIVRNELGHVKDVYLCKPLNYPELIKEIRDSYLIWTDSGGIQEEAPSLKKPVLILRTVTERPEVISSGFGKLVGTNAAEIVKFSNELLLNPKLYNKMISGKNPFGDGKASKRIADILLNE
jgi:UDP-N-acetylglucosamine 2-epimerase (non-hydrolysing)